mmetsp:Transcript_5446/g.16786  ORF Transcript_5446/g.16786 Transcript_5446/m.16786 type:complete len:127 (-) Transcript_5446:17-397(-)
MKGQPLGAPLLLRSLRLRLLLLEILLRCCRHRAIAVSALALAQTFCGGHRRRRLIEPRQKMQVASSPRVEWMEAAWTTPGTSRRRRAARQIAEPFTNSYTAWRACSDTLERPATTRTPSPASTSAS